MLTNQKNKNIIILISLVFLLLVVIIAFIFMNKDSKGKIDNNILEVEIIIKDHKFIPDTVEVPKFTKLRLVIKNEDDTVEEFESHDLHREKIVMPHESINIILAPLAPGRYEIFGDFHQDTAQGVIIVND
ncbi:MAG TPA: cupredoxin domain-containing protein [Rickettsia endosymbiont of Pyrocoelia pectoralis]|nr:cupredoxin domain-containing protein [Rickettsia endosymbiont of Pyrocoelia pectoralis]